MCNFENGFILCSCIDEEKVPDEKMQEPVKKKIRKKHKHKIKEEPKPIELKRYIWELRIPHRKEFAVGRCAIPSEDIGNGLESDWVELNLNDRNCFDFEYTPTEGDSLVFFNEVNRYRFLSFIFKGGEWVKDFYDEISEITKLKRRGQIKNNIGNKKSSFL